MVLLHVRRQCSRDACRNDEVARDTSWFLGRTIDARRIAPNFRFWLDLDKKAYHPNLSLHTPLNVVLHVFVAYGIMTLFLVPSFRGSNYGQQIRAS
jgi:hypothetical protein